MILFCLILNYVSEILSARLAYTDKNVWSCLDLYWLKFLSLSYNRHYVIFETGSTKQSLWNMRFLAKTHNTDIYTEDSS